MHYWDDPWFRKQHFMSRFAEKGYIVAYIEPTLSMVRKPDAYKKKYQTNSLFKVKIERRNDNLIIMKPPRGLPLWSRPFVSRLNYLYFSLKLSRILKRLGFKEYILWNYRPEYSPGIRIFNYRKLVYDITDDLAAYKQKKTREFSYIKKCTENIIEKSDMVIVTASTLYDKFKKMSKNILLIPNGYDANLFIDESTKVPDDIKKIKSPVIGFVGTLFSFLDNELLEYIIKNNSDKSFVFIGHCEDNFKRTWDELSRHKNVFWLGKKNKEDIPGYIRGFDVCINPFRVDNVSRSVSPLKVFEYLAMKKPVVSVRMESLEKEEVSPFIYFSSSHEDFNNKLNAAIREKDKFRERLDYKIVGEYSWDKLFEKVSRAIDKL
jgi:hypothetical protein